MDSIVDVDINDPFYMKICLKYWQEIESMADRYDNALDLHIDLKSRWEYADLSDQHREAIDKNYIQRISQKQICKEMGLNNKTLSDILKEGTQILSAYPKKVSFNGR